jgi:hypothetical protein
MFMLLQAARQWHSDTAEPPLGPASPAHAELLESYALRGRQTQHAAFRLLLEDLFPDETPAIGPAPGGGAGVVEHLGGSSLAFRPTRVKAASSAELVGVLRRSFVELMRYWQARDTVELLSVDMSEASLGLIRRIMMHATVQHVMTGMRLWSTLPCSVKRIEVCGLPPGAAPASIGAEEQ